MIADRFIGTPLVEVGVRELFGGLKRFGYASLSSCVCFIHYYFGFVLMKNGEEQVVPLLDTCHACMG